MELDQAVVVITGGSRGIGRAIAVALAAKGARVIPVARGREGATAVADDIVAAGGAASPEAADVTDPRQVQAVMDRVVEGHGGLDALVNAAGQFGGERGLLELSSDVWRELMAVNLDAAFYATEAALPHLLARGGGAVINLSSGAAVRTGFLNAAYGAAKAGLDRLTLGVDAEFRSAGIACVSVSPPLTRTPGTEALYGEGLSGRDPAPPEATAEAVARLLSGDAVAWSGQVVTPHQLAADAGD
jgi:NAD(P)-dependent dehydrogenase (short-subunit alcohol dehydrogenase family)